MTLAQRTARYARWVKILDGMRLLPEVELHLTDGEAELLITSLADCRDDLSSIGLSESHVPVSDGKTEVMVYVYATDKELEAGVADRTSDEP